MKEVPSFYFFYSILLSMRGLYHYLAKYFSKSFFEPSLSAQTERPSWSQARRDTLIQSVPVKGLQGLKGHILGVRTTLTYSEGLGHYWTTEKKKIMLFPVKGPPKITQNFWIPANQLPD